MSNDLTQRSGKFENNPRFHPIDATVCTGKHHLLRDDQGQQHSGRFRRGIGFIYSSGQPIPATITHYAAREAV